MYSSCPSNRQCISRQQPSRASKTSISSGWLLMTPFTVTNIRISLAFAWLFFFTIIAQFQSACMSTFKPTQILQHVQLYNPVVLSCKYTNLFTMPQLRLELPTALCKYRYQRINGFRRQLRLVGSSGQVAPIVLCPSKVSDFFQDSFKAIEFIKSLIYVICPLFFRLNPHCNSNSFEGSKFEFSKINPPIKAQQKPSACKACRPNLRCIKSGHKMHHNNGMATSCAHHVSLDPGTPNVDHQQWKPLDSPRLCNRRPPQDSFTKACTVKCRGFIDQENLSFWKALGFSWNKIVGHSES